MRHKEDHDSVPDRAASAMLDTGTGHASGVLGSADLLQADEVPADPDTGSENRGSTHRWER